MSEGNKRALKIDAGFPRQVLLVLAGVSLLGLYPLLRYASKEILVASIIGALLSTVNVLAGYAAIEYSYQKSYTVFLKVVLGGMGIRMAVMLGALWVAIGVLQVHAVALTFSMFLLYIVYLFLEVLFIQQKLSIRNQ